MYAPIQVSYVADGGCVCPISTPFLACLLLMQSQPTSEGNGIHYTRAVITERLNCGAP